MPNTLKRIYDKSRVLSFTDAVFSIALTVLILEVSIPTITEIRSNGTVGVLANLIPEFVGFTVSFLVIALHWVVHLRVSNRPFEMTRNLLRLHLFLLFFIVLLPFSTSFYVNGVSFAGPFVFYCANLVLIGLFQLLIIYRICDQHKQLSFDDSFEKAKSWVTFSVYILIGLLALVIPFYARFGFVLIFIFQPIAVRWAKRRRVAQSKPKKKKKL